MPAAVRCHAGDWVEVERVLLEPADRAPGLPEVTAATPLRMWVKGFARTDAALGEPLEIETMTGRTEHGALTAVLPGYDHTFGTPPPELVAVGRDLRARLAAWRARTSGSQATGAGAGTDAAVGER